MPFQPDEPMAMLHAFVADPEDGIWIATQYGVMRLDAGGRWRRLALPFAPEEWGANEALALALDARGRLWVGSRRGLASLR
ncbi:MAG: two-component regulator propeller domain-containing protein [Anaerolineae bacterium]